VISSPAVKRSPWLCRSPEKGYRVRQRAPDMALAPGLTAQPASLPSPAGWPAAPRGPRRRALRAPALWARAVSGVRGGSPGRQGTRDRRREAESRWLGRASGDAPGPGGSRIPALGGGAGLRGRRPRGRGLPRQLPGDAERGLPPPGPAGARATAARGNARLPREWGPRASPLLQDSADREAAALGRTWTGAGGWWPGGGSPLPGDGGGAGAGPGRPRPPKAGRSLAQGQVTGERDSGSRPRHPGPLGQKRPSVPVL
jgi:hypothetical protein